MEFRLSGNALKTFARSITCLALVGNELVIQASSYQAICSVLRTPIPSIDHLSVHLLDPDASKVRWTLECYSGVRKAYWIPCNVEPDIQHLSLDRRRFRSSLVVRPCDLNRLLNNFQSSLQEITVIATEPASVPSDAACEIGGKAVEFRSYIDPTKDEDSSLHTQLWIDPAEEFVQYTHAGNPVDVTFGVKELKALLAFCEGCEVDSHLYFEKAGEPILMAPKFGLDDASKSNFDSTLVLATMLISQLHKGNSSEPRQAATTAHGQTLHENGSQPQCRTGANISEHPSDHTRIWSELSGSGARSRSASEERQGQGKRNMNATEQRELQRISTMQISKNALVREEVPAGPRCHPGEKHHEEEARDRPETNSHCFSRRHRSNWVDADEDDDDNTDGTEMCVQSTPAYCEEQ